MAPVGVTPTGEASEPPSSPPAQVAPDPTPSVFQPTFTDTTERETPSPAPLDSKAETNSAQPPATSDEVPRKAPAPGTDLLNPLETTPEQQDGLEDQAARPVRAGKDSASGAEGSASGSAGHATAAASVGGSGQGSPVGGGGPAAGASASQPPPVNNPTAAQGAQFWMTLIAETGQSGPAPTVVIAAPAAVNASVVQSLLAAPLAPPAPTTAPPAVAPASQPAAASASPASPAASNPSSNPVSGSLVPIDPTINATEGTSWSGVVAQFTDSDGNVNTNVYNTSVSFGDGTAAVAGTVSAANGVFSVRVYQPHQYVEEGSDTATTTVTDTADNNVTTIQSPAAVSDAALTPSQGSFPSHLTAGTAFSGLLCNFSDADPGGVPGDYSSTPPQIAWGDGSTSTGTTSGSGNFFGVSGSHTYVAVGSYNVKVTGYDAGGASSTFQFTASVINPVSLTNPGTQNSTEGNSVSLTPTASDANNQPLTFFASGLPAGLSINPSSGQISGTLATGTAALGPYQTTVTATDGTYTASTQFVWNVSSPLTLTNPGTQTSSEGNTVALSLSATDSNSGATLSYAATGLPAGLKINPGTGQITGSVAAGAAANGPYSVSLSAGNGSASARTSFTWNVSSPITITVPADQSNNAGASVSLVMTASDSHSGTLSWSASSLPNGLSLNASTGAISEKKGSRN